jgi:hypothetical protein
MHRPGRALPLALPRGSLLPQACLGSLLQLQGTLQQRLGSLQRHLGSLQQRQGRHWRLLGRLRWAELGQQTLAEQRGGRSLAEQRGQQTLAGQRGLRSQAVLGRHQSLQLQVRVLLQRRQSRGRRQGSLLALLLLLWGLWLRALQRAVLWGALALVLVGHLGWG